MHKFEYNIYFLISRLLLPNSPILKRLGQMVPFEITVGNNGRIWLKSTSLARTLVLVQAVNVLEYASEADLDRMCESLQIKSWVVKSSCNFVYILHILKWINTIIKKMKLFFVVVAYKI